MKNILYTAFVAILLMAGGKAGANACKADCKFSCCYISCPDPCAVACGCFFGVASCKSEISKPVKTINAAAIQNFGNYASSLSNAQLMNLYETLKNLKADDTYDLILEQYKLKVEQLSKENREILDAYLAQ